MAQAGQADDRRLIALVRERPLLYARNNMPVASYYSSVKRLWQEVALRMDWTVAEARRKWSHIRNSYSRHLRNEAAGACTGRGRMVSRWYLADELDFLRAHMATDKRAPAPPTMLPLDPPDDDVKPFAAAWFVPPPAAGPGAGAEGEADSYEQFFLGLRAEYGQLSARRRRRFRRRCLEALHALLDEQERAAPSPPPGALPSPDSTE